MNILIDQNLSPRLVDLLADIYPGSTHVQSISLDRASDDEIWIYARNGDFVILAKDADFNQISVIRGTPPKVLWVQLGNCTTDEVEAAIRRERVSIDEFGADPETGTFVLRRPGTI
jgi:predicted nuclease of predicted toxin-antitoxin system